MVEWEERVAKIEKRNTAKTKCHSLIYIENIAFFVYCLSFPVYHFLSICFLYKLTI